MSMGKTRMKILSWYKILNIINKMDTALTVLQNYPCTINKQLNNHNIIITQQNEEGLIEVVILLSTSQMVTFFYDFFL